MFSIAKPADGFGGSGGDERETIVTLWTRSDRGRAGGDRRGNGRLPDFLIVGAMKAGTTSLSTWLSAHPDVFMPRKKELHFFDVYHENGLDWYRERFQGGEGHRVAGEATPGYMFRPVAFERMADAVPNARLIALLRNPIDRAYSHYWHRREGGLEDREFEELVRLELADLEVAKEWAGYLARGQYAEQLRRVTARYPRERFLVRLLEDLADSPELTYLETCRFLGIDERVPAVVGVIYTRGKARQRPYDKALNRLRVDRWLSRRATRLLRSAGRKSPTYPPMSTALRAQLVEYFEPYNADLSAWLGRDVSHWNR